MTDIEIRDFAPADGPAVIALARELQAHEAALFDRMRPPDEIDGWYLDGLLEACRKHAGRFLVAVRGDVHLGYAVVLTALSSEDETDERPYSYAAVRDLAVTDPARGKVWARGCSRPARRSPASPARAGCGSRYWPETPAPCGLTSASASSHC